MQPGADVPAGQPGGQEPLSSRSSGAAGHERRLTALALRSRALTGLLEEDGTVAYLSPGAVQVLTGRADVEEFQGDDPAHRIHPDDFPVLAEAFAAAHEHPGAPIRFRARTRHDDGTYRFVEGEFTNHLADPEVAGIGLTVVDVTEQVRVETELRERLEVEQVLSAISVDFVDGAASDVDSCIESALRAVGELTDADRAYVFRVDDDGTVSNTHEWVRDGIGSLRSRLQHLPLASHPWGARLLQERAPLLVCSLDDLPLEAETERELFAGLGIRSLANTPMVEHGRPIGFVGVETQREERDWSPVVLTALGQLAAMVTSALDRHRSEVAREQSELARRTSEDRFRRLIQSSPDLVLVLDPAGTITFASSICEQIVGWRPDERVGTVAWDLIHPDDLDEVLAAMGDVIAGNLRGRDPARMRVAHKNGSWVPVEVTATNLLDDPVLGGVVVNVRDMRERVRIEATLHEAEVRFQQAWHHAPIGMGLAAPDGTLLRVNPSFCEMLGYAEEEMLQYRLSDITHPDDVHRNAELHEQLFRGDRRSYTLEKRYRRKDGSFMWARASVSLVRDDQGEPLYSIGQIEDITERRRLQDQLAFEASHDALTGLPLRKRLVEDLEHALASAHRRRTGVGVLFVDLDHFKRVNDGFGHVAGDELLVEVARRLRSCVRSIDTAARFGGDEFVIVCPDLVHPDDAVRVAHRIRERLSEPFVVRGAEVQVGASIGIALADDEIDAATLLGRADTAAYRAKDRGRNRWEIFDDELRASVTRALDTELALRRALDRDELRLFYQPIVVLATGEVRGFEALVRWDRPGYGLVPPAEFLPVAEETGLIVALDQYVLATACRDLATWQDLVPDRGTPLLSVNLSDRQLVQRELLDELAAVLEETGADASRLCLELGENVLVQDPDSSLAMLGRLRELGVHMAIDDFGAGYSSLSHLRRVPLAHVKIDRSLVLELGADPTGALIAESVVNLARSLGMQVVAVGVESHDHVRALRDLGCELAQGYFFSPPVPGEIVPTILSAGALPLLHAAGA